MRSPSGSRDGVARGVAPQTFDDLTVGSHTVVLESIKGTVRKTVDIAVDRTAEVSEGIYSGWLHISSPLEIVAGAPARTKRPRRENRRGPWRHPTQIS